MHDVWRKLPTGDAFQSKGTLPKLSRWFSWNQSCEEQLPSWNILKLVLKYHFWEKDIDPDVAAQKRELAAIAQMDDPKEEEKVNVRKQFSLLKEKLGGGLKLALYCLSDRLWQQVQILQMVSRPTWTWYSASVRNMKNSQDHVERLMALAQYWQQDEHLQSTAAVPTAKSPELLNLLH